MYRSPIFGLWFSGRRKAALTLKPALVLALRTIRRFLPSPVFGLVRWAMIHFLDWLSARLVHFLDWYAPKIGLGFLFFRLLLRPLGLRHPLRCLDQISAVRQ
jgi:hypothetical protein